MNHEERIKAAMQRYFEKQEGRARPAVRDAYRDKTANIADLQDDYHDKTELNSDLQDDYKTEGTR